MPPERRITKRTRASEPQNSAGSWPERNALLRGAFKTSDGKRLTAFQWRVYDLVNEIPAGRVTTYAALAQSLASSARAVGQALRVNPFAPRVPCHRVIGVNGFLGGYQGDWEKDADNRLRSKVGRKLELLREEGLEFDERGYLLDLDCMWKPNKV